MPAPTHCPHTARLVAAYENLRPETLAALLNLYDKRARFRDPFNDVHGRTAIGRIFEHMFATLDQPRFVVTRALSQGTDVFLTWDFRFGWRKGATLCIQGATHLQLSPDGTVLVHRDYWDAAQELYEQVPLLGVLMRALRRRLSTPQTGPAA